MARFADHTVAEFLDALASPDPTPGGGTAAAVAGAMGVSLLMMVAGLTRSRTNADSERAALGESKAALSSVKDRMLALADTDTESFNQVMAAYRLPKSTDAEAQARRRAVQRGMRAATEAPLETLRTAVDAMKHARVVAEHGHRSAASDVRVALELLEASAAGAAANVEINLASLDDEGFRKSAASDVLERTNHMTEDAAAARAALS
ncbi:MAG: cyclodeaminase/cyclohydrolase family protein [Vicinamibacterales bacterium]